MVAANIDHLLTNVLELIEVFVPELEVIGHIHRLALSQVLSIPMAHRSAVEEVPEDDDLVGLVILGDIASDFKRGLIFERDMAVRNHGNFCLFQGVLQSRLGKS